MKSFIASSIHRVCHKKSSFVAGRPSELALLAPEVIWVLSKETRIGQ